VKPYRFFDDENMVLLFGMPNTKKSLDEINIIVKYKNTMRTICKVFFFKEKVESEGCVFKLGNSTTDHTIIVKNASEYKGFETFMKTFRSAYCIKMISYQTDIIEVKGL
jgi:hypothetical protein